MQMNLFGHNTFVALLYSATQYYMQVSCFTKMFKLAQQIQTEKNYKKENRTKNKEKEAHPTCATSAQCSPPSPLGPPGVIPLLTVPLPCAWRHGRGARRDAPRDGCHRTATE